MLLESFDELFRPFHIHVRLKEYATGNMGSVRHTALS